MKHLLIEHPLGYTLFQVKSHTPTSTPDYSTAHSTFRPISHVLFQSLAQSLETNQEEIEAFVKSNNVKKLYCDRSLKINGVELRHSDFLMRSARLHLKKLCKFGDEEIKNAATAIAHAKSKAKIEFSEEKGDNELIQAAMSAEQVGKEAVEYTRVLKQKFSFFLPELEMEFKDESFLLVLKNIFDVLLEDVENKGNLIGREDLRRVAIKLEIDKLLRIVEVSVGQSITLCDLMDMDRLLNLVMTKTEEFKVMSSYVDKKMKVIAPNLRNLIGSRMGSNIIAHCGGLSNLAMCPASTVQVLGSETALFRALKAKKDTPKYGLMHSLLKGKNKGRKSRYLANKVSICARIDYFGNTKGEYGKELRIVLERKMKDEKVENTDVVIKRVVDKIKSRKNKMEGMDKNYKENKNGELKEKDSKKIKYNKKESDGDNIGGVKKRKERQQEKDNDSEFIIDNNDKREIKKENDKKSEIKKEMEDKREIKKEKENDDKREIKKERVGKREIKEEKEIKKERVSKREIKKEKEVKKENDSEREIKKEKENDGKFKIKKESKKKKRKVQG